MVYISHGIANEKERKEEKLSSLITKTVRLIKKLLRTSVSKHDSNTFEKPINFKNPQQTKHIAEELRSNLLKYTRSR